MMLYNFYIKHALLIFLEISSVCVGARSSCERERGRGREGWRKRKREREKFNGTKLVVLKWMQYSSDETVLTECFLKLRLEKRAGMKNQFQLNAIISSSNTQRSVNI
jgi:hypothetical protein